MVRKKVLMSLMAIALAGAMIGGGVFAAFSDTETSHDNAFAAGTLDLKVDGKDDPEVSAYFNVSNAKPGDTGQVVITLSNAGTLDGNAYLVIQNVADSPGETPEPEPTPDEGELSEHLIITIDWGAGSVTDELCDLAGTNFDIGTLGAGDSKDIIISYEIPSNVGNVIQGDSVSFDILFGLNQA